MRPSPASCGPRSRVGEGARSCPSGRQGPERRGDARPGQSEGQQGRGAGMTSPRRVSLSGIAKYKRIETSQRWGQSNGEVVRAPEEGQRRGSGELGDAAGDR